MALAVWVAFPYNNWSWLCLLASPLCLWLGWGVCRSRETLRRRILLLIPLCALWLFAAIQLLGVWRLLCPPMRCTAVWCGSFPGQC